LEFEALESLMSAGEVPGRGRDKDKSGGGSSGRNANVEPRSAGSLFSTQLPALIRRQPGTKTNNSSSRASESIIGGLFGRSSSPGNGEPLHQHQPEEVKDSESNQFTPGYAKFCHECGTSYPTSAAKFCPECGERRVANV
jgi:hypothetical protein